MVRSELSSLVPERDREVRQLLWAGRVGEANRLFDEVLAERPVAADAGARAVLLVFRALSAWLLRRVPLTLDLAAQGWSELDSTVIDSRSRADVLAQLGFLVTTVGNWQVGMDLFRRAAEAARTTDDEDMLALNLQWLGGVLNFRAIEAAEARRERVFREAATVLRDGLGLRTHQQTRQGLLAAYSRSLVGLGELDRAAEIASEALRLSERSDFRWGVAVAGWALACVHRARRELIPARTLTSRALYQAELIQDPALVERFSRDLVEICAELGDAVGETAALRRRVSAQQSGLEVLREGLSQALQQCKFAIQARRLADAANEAAARDTVTGLANRLGVERAAPQLLEQTRAQGGVPWLILFDVDRFKGINDRAGHPQGDVALREVGKVLRGECRAHDLVARWAGDEFVVVLGEITGDHPGVGLAVAERIRAAVESRNWTDVLGAVGPLTLSVGVVAGPASFEELFAAADRALYQAKRRGRNRVEVHARLDIEPDSAALTRRDASM